MKKYVVQKDFVAFARHYRKDEVHDFSEWPAEKVEDEISYRFDRLFIDEAPLVGETEAPKSEDVLVPEEEPKLKKVMWGKKL